MSRLAKKPVIFPKEVTVALVNEELVIKGPKGELKVRVTPDLKTTVEGEGVMVQATNETKQARANSGTVWSLTRNAVEGVTKGFEKILEIEGVGYRAALDGENLSLSLGYVNPVKVFIPKGLTVGVEKNTVIKISGIDKEMVGQFAAKVRSLKKPEPYKGKGIRYQGEVIRRKVGKKAATSG